MSKVAIVYWSGTGNTEAMAQFIAKGIESKGISVDLLTPGQFSKSMLSSYKAIAFGCPSMGAEVLEEEEFQPMWDSVKDHLQGKSIVLFGSYGWGDGEWMRDWEQDTPYSILESYICNEAPDAEAESICISLGEKLASC